MRRTHSHAHDSSRAMINSPVAGLQTCNGRDDHLVRVVGRMVAAR